MKPERASVDSRGVKHFDPTCRLQYSPGDINHMSIKNNGDHYCKICCIEPITDIK